MHANNNELFSNKNTNNCRSSEKQHRRSSSERSHSIMMAEKHEQKSYTWDPPSYMHSELTDPITRDVERRLSLTSSSKRVNNHGSSSLDDVFTQKRSTSIFNTASDFLRGTVQKMRKHAANLTKNIKGSSENKNMNSSLTIAASEEITPAVNCLFSESQSLPSNIHEQQHKTKTASTTTTATRTAGICRSRNIKKGSSDFEHLRLVQEVNNEHTGAIWCIKFSDCGRLLATAGQDRKVRVWVLRSHLNYFTSICERHGIIEEEKALFVNNFAMHQMEKAMHSSAATKQDSGCSKVAQTSCATTSISSFASTQPPSNLGDTRSRTPSIDDFSPAQFEICVFSPKPFCVFQGHMADVVDLNWSPRNFLLLSAGMDRTVKLWHLTRQECLCSFQHVDFVTSVVFMPKDDRYFISGSLDGKIRLWNIPEKRVAVWNEVEEVVKFITAITFAKNGKIVVVGTYSGHCFFYSADQLKYHTVLDVRSKKGKQTNSLEEKITSLAVNGDKLLVTSSNSRIRTYDLRDMNLCCKYKGPIILQSLIKATFSLDGKHIISGSEDSYIYLWRTSANGLPSSLAMHKGQNHAWERVRAHQMVVTTGIFAPNPQLIINSWLEQKQQHNQLKHIASNNNSGPFETPLLIATRKLSSSTVIDSKEKYELSKTPADSDLLSSKHLQDIRLPKCSSKVSSASLGYSSMLSIPAGSSFGSSSTGTGNENLPVLKQQCVLQGDVIISADLSGCLKIFMNIPDPSMLAR